MLPNSMGNYFGRFCYRLIGCFEVEKWGFGRFVRAVDTGKTFDLSGTGLGVQSLYVARFTDFEGRIDEDFEKVVRADDVARHRPDFAGGAYERTQHLRSRRNKKPGSFCNTTDILSTIFEAEAQVAAKARPNIVAIEEHDKVASGKELTLYGSSNGGFPGAGKPRKPENTGPVRITLFTLFTLHSTFEDRVYMVSHKAIIACDGAKIPAINRFDSLLGGF